ncbi:MAG: molybdopterin converting factor subunit 1 [Gammaproteobacteria bacterium]|nr:molybdopterin converting factor subunit 1 [Gammaproteobacteria bacterium]
MPRVTIRYFASLRERLGRAEEVLDLEGIRTVAEVWARATGEPLPANTLVAVNLEYADFSQPLRDGDEVAFFPPVTGG